MNENQRMVVIETIVSGPRIKLINDVQGSADDAALV
jgi:hypothetical protein